MLAKVIPIVHRFIPFTFALSCALFFVLIPGKVHAENLFVSPTPNTTVPAADLNAYHAFSVNSVQDITFLVNGNSPIGVTGTVNSFTVLLVDTPSTSYTNTASWGLEGCSVAWTYSSGSWHCSGTHTTSYGGTISVSGQYYTLTLTSPVTLNSAYYYYVQYRYSNQPGGGVYDHTMGTVSGTSGGTCNTLYYDLNFYNSIDPRCSTGTLTNVYVVLSGSGGFVPPVGECESGDTRICAFTPENGTTVTGPNVDFTLEYYVSPSDIGGFIDTVSDVTIKLHNIDQNVLLFGFLSDSDIVLYNEVATTSGKFTFATTTALADGNYRLEASIKRKFFFNWVTVPFNNVNQTISKQFIVGTPSFIGTLTQNGFSILNGVATSSTATSSIALVAQCNPLGSFDMTNCLFGLFVPDSGQINTVVQGARDGILTRIPWGYFVRTYDILASSSTSTLPTFTATVALNTASDTTEIAIDPGDMFTGGAALLASVHDPYNDKTARDIFEPIVKMTIALLVVLTIYADVTGSHKHHSETADIGSRRRRV